MAAPIPDDSAGADRGMAPPHQPGPAALCTGLPPAPETMPRARSQTGSAAGAAAMAHQNSARIARWGLVKMAGQVLPEVRTAKEQSPHSDGAVRQSRRHAGPAARRDGRRRAARYGAGRPASRGQAGLGWVGVWGVVGLPNPIQGRAPAPAPAMSCRRTNAPVSQGVGRPC